MERSVRRADGEGAGADEVSDAKNGERHEDFTSHA
jgi:hypothetical protein